MLYGMFKDEKNRLYYIIYPKSSLTNLQLAKKAFKGERTDPAKLLNSLVSVLQSVCSRLARPTVHFYMQNTPIADYVNNVAYLGYSFENATKNAKLPVEEEQLTQAVH